MASTYNAKKYNTNNISNTTQVNNVEKDTSNTAQVVNTNNVESKTGATQSQNAIASGIANAGTSGIQRAIGSLGTTNNNTNTTGSAVSSPATTTPQNVSLPANPIQDFITNYANAINNQDLSGQISALTQLDEYNVSQGGQPMFSDVIGNLKSKNSEQVINTVNDYGTQLYEAVRTGNKDLANGLMAELGEYKEKNNYQNVLSDMQVQLNNEYSFAYMQGINDITNGILNLVNKYANFQYNPANDMALQMAQGYAVSAVKEQMNATGMYYSSITQNAITRAINELVPVYEQMAKEELMNNINLLQSTASYLMNLEKSQFDMWASQLELQFRANEDRRQEVELAWDRTNKLGYVDNEASLVLGLEVGTLSPDARKAILEEEADIRAERRKLDNSMTLEKYTNDLAVDLAQKKYYIEKYGTYDEKEIEKIKNNGTNSSVLGIQSLGGKDYTTESGGTISAIGTLLSSATALANNGVSKFAIWDSIFSDAKTPQIALNAIKQAKDENGEYIFDSKFINDNGIQAYAVLLELEDITTDVTGNIGNVGQIVNEAVNLGSLTDKQATAITEKYLEDTIYTRIDEVAKGTEDENGNKVSGYNGNSNYTKGLVEKLESEILQKGEELYSLNGYSAEGVVTLMYEKLIDTIKDAETFDYKWSPFNQGKASKKEAIETIINNISELDETKLGGEKDKIVENLRNYYSKLQFD